MFKGKFRPTPPVEESSGGSSDEFEPSNESELNSDEDDDEGRQEDDDIGFDFDDGVLRRQRKQARQGAKDKVIKMALVEGLFVCHSLGSLGCVSK